MKRINQNTNTLYIFIDESGNFDFSPSGTKYFILTSVTTLQPLEDRWRFAKLRYNLLKGGMDQECFHATEDKQRVRDLVYENLAKLADLEIDAVIAQKNKAHPSLYLEVKPRKARRDDDFLGRVKIKHSGEEIYKLLSQTLLQYIFGRYDRLDDIDKIVVVLGSIFTKNKRELILKSLKQYLKRKTKKPFYIYFHKAEADINCQLADYCGWALYVKAERGESRPYSVVKNKIKSAFDIFSRGTVEYYEYKE